MQVLISIEEQEIRKGYVLIMDIILYSKNRINYKHLLVELEPLVKKHKEIRDLIIILLNNLKRGQ